MADLIVKADYLVSMAPESSVQEKAAVVVRDGVIIAVGPEADIAASYQADKVIGGEGRVLMPGLINGHTHTAMTMFRGVADDYELMTWLQKYIFPLEGQFVDPEMIEIGSSLACLEMIETGTTNFVDMYFYPEVIAAVVERCGVRATLSAPAIDFPSPGFKGWDDSFAAAKKFVADWMGKHPRIRPAYAPHAPYTVSEEHLAEVVAEAKKTGGWISMHLAEDKSETETILERYGKRPIPHVADIGMLDVNMIAAHVVWPNEDEIKMLAEAPLGAIHNPTSNMKTAAGFAPIPQMLKAGVKVGLATDGAASNNNLDMWEEIRLAALLHKGVSGDATAVPARAALHMATLGGAEAIGQNSLVGSLEVGKRADMIQISLESTETTPLYDVISHLVYAVNSRDVVTTIVDGAVLMEDRQVKSLNAEEVRAAAVRKGAEIKKAIAK
ncbi:N-ethylammeline chlorohydrolase [Kordiimonas sediminis]|uniref:5-methylthioadenosine/S-adenosylhomocysteine deaminase n=2 Tax=Kordiimonas sediminis TaxID=1735581 RepID=A0A919ASW3_9PROT|nr:N-ethylammeline chlorohydrolase [Kordiimonas sediminis]